MIKYFHELTEKEFKELLKKKLTWGELAIDYPQPIWCDYPDALLGMMGCWSLMDFMVKDETYCEDCSHYRPIRQIKPFIQVPVEELGFGSK